MPTALAQSIETLGNHAIREHLNRVRAEEMARVKTGRSRASQNRADSRNYCDTVEK
jgi:hypothetical protein